jgi:hypothetical protein
MWSPLAFPLGCLLQAFPSAVGSSNVFSNGRPA